MIAGFDPHCAADELELAFQQGYQALLFQRVIIAALGFILLWLTLWCFIHWYRNQQWREHKLLVLIVLIIFWPLSVLVYSLIMVKRTWLKGGIVLFAIPIVLLLIELGSHFLQVAKQFSAPTAVTSVLEKIEIDLFEKFYHFPHYRELLENVNISQLTPQQRCDLLEKLNDLDHYYPYAMQLHKCHSDPDRTEQLVTHLQRLTANGELTPEEYTEWVQVYMATEPTHTEPQFCEGHVILELNDYGQSIQ